MADHAVGDDFFVYTGGIAPLHVVNAIIDESVEEINIQAFRKNRNLKSVVCHDGVLKVGGWAFNRCRSLERVKMPGVKIIGYGVFYYCNSLVDVELDNLEMVQDDAFSDCTSLQRVKLPKVKTIGISAFRDSGVDVLEFGEDLETIRSGAFQGSKLRRIAIPLKDGMFQWNDYLETYTQFSKCYNLATVDLVGGVHKTVASLHLESWRNEMNEEIQQINQILPVIDHDEKSSEIVEWIQLLISKIEHYKSEHRAVVKEVATLLELALWKAKLADFIEEGDVGVGPAEENTERKAKIDDDEGTRKEARITSGADIVIKNVLPFLMMVE
jgi:hypothetical protein